MDNFSKMLEKQPVVFDGAMGTMLYSRGIFINRNFDELNLSRPDLVEKIHADYISAGAMVIETNTFGANPIKLSKYGLEDKVLEINKAGVALAKGVAGKKALVAGSIGPTGLVPDIFDQNQMEMIRLAFHRQASALIEAGVDLLVLETFRYPIEMKIAINTVKNLGSIPIVATMTFDAEGKTADGIGPERVAHLLKEWGATVIGANCGEGPSAIFDVVLKMLSAGLPVIAQPNAGVPRRLEGRVIYMTTPEYFGEYAKRFLSHGISIIGGCCGTTPEHIRQVASECRMVSGGRIRIEGVIQISESVEETFPKPPSLENRSLLGKYLSSGFVISVEVDPPSGIDPTKTIEGVKKLSQAGIRFVNIADGPRATARMSAIALALLITKETPIEPIIHVTCRDRNILGIQADLLGAHAHGLRNLLIITGDPAKLGDYPDATTVYDLDSIGLLRLVTGLNMGVEPSGRRIQGQTMFVKGCGVEPGTINLEKEIERLKRKVDAGAEFAMTQPVFDPEVMERFLTRAQFLDIPIIMGVLPLASYKNAEFLHNEVPGMTIPEEIRKRMKSAGAQGREEGIKIAREMIYAFRHKVQGLYIMPPFNRFETALAVLDGII